MTRVDLFIQNNTNRTQTENFTTNRRLGNTFEAKLGKGKILVTTIDLKERLNERPVARQLRYSLIQYIESEQFDPSGKISARDLNTFVQVDNLNKFL